MNVLRAAALYAFLTVVLTWPFARQLHVMDPGDSAWFAWAMSWELHALATDPASLPHANIYHPARWTLGMDEPILGTTLLALPLRLVTDDAVWIFNVTRLATFLLSALGAWFLARTLGLGEAVALFAGAAFAFSPIRTDQVSHLSTLGSQWLPFCLAFVVRFARAGRLADGLAAGGFYVLSAYACGYHGVFGLLVLPAFALPLVWGRWDRVWRALPALVLVGLCLLPLRLLHARAFEAEDFERDDHQVLFHSAALESFLATSSWNRVYGELTTPFRTLGSNNLFPGLVLPGVVLAAALRLLRRRERPSREAVAFLLLAVAAALVCVGPVVRWRGEALFAGPYALVREWIPLFQGIRVMSRAGIYVALGLVGLAALGLRGLQARPALVALLGVAALGEGLVAPLPLPEWAKVIDTRRPPPPVYPWLAGQAGEFAIVEMPLLVADGFFRRPAYDETIYMVRSTLHWKRLVNGNAGVEPARYLRIRELARRFPSVESLQALHAIGTRYVIVHRAGYGPNQWRRVSRQLPGFDCCLRPVVSFEDGVTVYELVAAPNGS